MMPGYYFLCKCILNWHLGSPPCRLLLFLFARLLFSFFEQKAAGRSDAFIHTHTETRKITDTNTPLPRPSSRSPFFLSLSLSVSLLPCALKAPKTNPCVQSGALRKKTVHAHKARPCRKRRSAPRSCELSGQCSCPSAVRVQLESSWNSQLEFAILKPQAAPGHRNALKVEVF